MESEERSPSEIERFLLDLSAVSYRHGLAIGTKGEVYVMVSEDYESRYFLNGESYLIFGP